MIYWWEQYLKSLTVIVSGPICSFMSCTTCSMKLATPMIGTLYLQLSHLLDGFSLLLIYSDLLYNFLPILPWIVLFRWEKSCSCFLLNSICLKYNFTSFHFESVCVSFPVMWAFCKQQTLIQYVTFFRKLRLFTLRVFFFFCTGAWTQDLQQPFCVCEVFLR
jgi:hypothetical protein